MAQADRLIKPEVEAFVVLQPEAYFGEVVDNRVGEVIEATCQIQVIALMIAYEAQGWPCWRVDEVVYVFASE